MTAQPLALDGEPRRLIGVAAISCSDIVKTGLARFVLDAGDWLHLVGPDDLDTQLDVVVYDAGGLAEGPDELRQWLASGVAVVVLTRDLHPELTRLAGDLGARRFVSTAVSPRQLAAIIARAAEDHGGHDDDGSASRRQDARRGSRVLAD